MDSVNEMETERKISEMIGKWVGIRPITDLQQIEQLLQNVLFAQQFLSITIRIVDTQIKCLSFVLLVLQSGDKVHDVLQQRD